MRQNLGGRRPPSITTAKPLPHEGDKGVAKLKCTPRPHFCPVPVSLLLFCQPCNPHSRGSSDQGLIRIAENFRAEGAKKKMSPCLVILGTFLDPNLLIFDQNPFCPNKGNCLIEETLRIRAYTNIFRCFPNRGNTLIKATRWRRLVWT